MEKRHFGSKRNEQLLFESKEMWECTFNSIPDLIAILDTDFRIIRVNQAMADRFGLPPDQFPGKTCFGLFHGTAKPPAYCPHAQSIKDQKEHHVDSFEKKLEGYFHITTSPILNPSGEMIGSVHIAHDITKRKRAEEEKEKVILELQQALQNIKTLSGLIPICSGCKKIRNDHGYWEQIETFIKEHSEATFSHGLCPDCVKRLYPEIHTKMNQNRCKPKSKVEQQLNIGDG